jgi:hypothetical protein
MKKFGSARTSSPNAGADLHCPVTPSSIGLKRGDNCFQTLATELKGSNHESTQRDRIFLQKETKARNAIRFQDTGFVLFVIFCKVDKMENALVDLAHALRERLAIIHDEESRRDEAKHMARLRAVSKKIDQLQAALPQPIDPRLAHYLQRKSYDKALELIENPKSGRD